jgi:hypothetical protein
MTENDRPRLTSSIRRCGASSTLAASSDKSSRMSTSSCASADGSRLPSSRTSAPSMRTPYSAKPL